MSLLPRTIGLADFLTTDEAYHWIDRTTRFAQALAEQRWAGTIQTGHPGVTVMWLGTIGLVLERVFSAGFSESPALLHHLAWMRLPAAVLHAALVLWAWYLLRSLVGKPAALLASLFWATSPYLIAHARLLHLDALLTDFVIMSVLLLLVAMQNQRLALVGSGVFAGFALLTKGPALIILPFVGIVVFGFQLQRQARNPQLVWGQSMLRALIHALGQYALWLGCALLVVVVFWPALWVTPQAALARYVSEITVNGGRPNGDGQFFLGQAIADPGWAFYIIANLFRTTPLMLIGLILLAGLSLVGRGNGLSTNNLGSTMLVLVALIGWWTLVMSLGPKKFDRYVLPTWPALLILAGCGWASLVGFLQSQISIGSRLRTGLVPLAAVLFSLVELFGIRQVHPYYLSYYNPMLGGGAAAERNLLIGWGEGMDQVGQWLRTRPDLQYGPVLSALPPTLQPFVPVDVRDVSDYGRLPANYAVVYLESVQRAADPALYARLQTTVPLQRVLINGIEYARIYQLPRPYTKEIGALFGESLLLRGITLEQRPEQLVVTPAWDVRAAPAGNYLVFLHLLSDAGTRVAQIDLAPGGDGMPATSAWQPGQQIAVPLPLDLPAGLPAGQYQLVLGVYEPAGGRLPFHGGTSATAEYAGQHALLLETITLP